MTITIIIALIYGIIALGFFLAMITESRKQEVPINLINVFVAIAWPIWGIWYALVLIQEWRRDRKISRR